MKGWKSWADNPPPKDGSTFLAYGYWNPINERGYGYRLVRFQHGRFETVDMNGISGAWVREDMMIVWMPFKLPELPPEIEGIHER